MTWTTSHKDIVLIVDDVPDNLAMLSDSLDEQGYVVLVATDGMSAIERLNHVTPDMILLDAMMPGMDGFETCRRIKARKGADHIPVVFMTGLTDTEHVLKGFQSGGIDYVTKPIHPLEVIARIDTHIKNARALSRAREAIDAAEHGVIALDRNHVPLWHTSKAVLWLTKYFHDACPSLTALPSRVLSWLNEAGNAGAPAHETLKTLVMAKDASRLTVQFACEERDGQTMLLLEERTAMDVAVNPIDSCSLTPREADVLAWLAKGKTNRDIADILGMSPRTVNKHLEHIFVKLGVETRSAATALAMTRIYGVAELCAR
jgi:DNA-binding response OmpR family regulator/DNA-binding CsgD family transcriptional regulator